MDADGLRLVVAVVVLDAHQVGVGLLVEARPHGQHVVVGLAHGLHQLQGRMEPVTGYDVVREGLIAGGPPPGKPDSSGIMGNDPR